MSKRAATSSKKGAKEKEKKEKHVEHAAHAAHAAPAAPVASEDFEAGIMFNKYDKTRSGVVTAADFRMMWKEVKENLHNSGGAAHGKCRTQNFITFHQTRSHLLI